MIVGGARLIRFNPVGTQLACGGVKPSSGGTVQGDPTLLIFDTETSELKATLTFGVANDCYLHDVHWTDDDVLICVTSGTPGSGKLIMRRIEDEKAFYETTKMPNCTSVKVSYHWRKAEWHVESNSKSDVRTVI